MNDKPNYLEHEIRVKVLEQLLDSKTDFTWFAEYLANSFDLVDITTWSEFEFLRNRLFDSFLLILRIVKQHASIIAEDLVIQDLVSIALFYYGVNTLEETKDILNTSFGSIFLLSIWITKLFNADNKRTDIINNSFLMLKNAWKLYSIDSLVDNKNSIVDYSNSIDAEGFEPVRNTLISNIDKIAFSSSNTFIDEIKHRINYNSFSFQTINIDGVRTWEEQFLIDMFNVSFRNLVLNPMMTTSTGCVPDITLWTNERLEHMESFFHDDLITFIIDSIRFYLFDLDPTLKTVNTHCTLLLEAFDNEPNENVLLSSSFDFILRILNHKISGKYVKEDSYGFVMKKLHSITEISSIEYLDRKKFPISIDQKKILEDYFNGELNSISSISNIPELVHYCENQNYTKYMTDDLLEELNEKFLELIIDFPKDQMIPSVFYYYLVFLMIVRTENAKINKLAVEQTLIELQTIWQEEYYELAKAQLQELTVSQTISKVEIETINDEIYRNPIAVASGIVMSKDKDLCGALELISKMPLRYLFSTIRLNNYYPELENGIDYEKHDINVFLRELIERIVEENRYRFLNNVDLDKYVVGILDRYKDNLNFIISFLDEERLYNDISRRHDLIPYSSSPKVAHVVQLFPLIETIIGHYAKFFGIFPFKLNSDNFMSHKDPSSILREMIKTLYKETNSFEVMPDLIFVYNFLYNSSSLNIRNECIHARDYQSAQGLHFALRVSLLAIKMLDYRFDKVFAELKQ